MAKYEEMKDGRWILEISERISDIWYGESFFDTKEEAIQEGYWLAEKENLKFFRVGLCESETNYGIDVDNVIEHIQETTYDEVGEVAEDYLNDVTTEDLLELEKKLNDVFYKWQKEHKYEPNFYRIVATERINIKKEGEE